MGDLTETLRLGDAGVFAYPAARAAFAACVDQDGGGGGVVTRVRDRRAGGDPQLPAAP
ncbi:hypothetical protein QP028_14825 [Corynebacterium suedekumii]|nr:hypothetical protein QP028_14825 [Corynebacterium suedekumii]